MPAAIVRSSQADECSQWIHKIIWNHVHIGSISGGTIIPIVKSKFYYTVIKLKVSET